MPELVFISTNPTKLAHFRHIAKRFGIDVAFFRRKTFLASYEEPRSANRDDLLRRSYESALDQWNKAELLTGKTLFFIEDTSVRIDALSITEEVPGVEIKYWMRDTSFETLNSQLLASGNNRLASVRSDIVLSLPEELRPHPTGYEVFTGIVEGRIIDAETTFSTNPVYPWLDNKSFNKWFVPDGEMLPLGALPIEKAIHKDFRFFAFEKLVQRLRDVRPATFRRTAQASQYELAITSPLLEGVVICGPSCAGKTTLAEFLREKYGWYHFEASDFMYRAMYERNGVSSQTSIAEFAQRALLDEPDIVASQILKKTQQRPQLPFVVTGFRSPKEVDSLINGLPRTSRILLIYLDAHEELRFARYLSRGREESISQEEFHERDLNQLKMGLDQMQSTLAMESVWNNLQKADMYDAFEKVLGKTGANPAAAAAKAKSLGEHQAARFPLEAAILTALLPQSASGNFFTTAEIARLINSNESSQRMVRSKDNVSRYFNQDFYPYFELELRGGKKRYRLSNTGRSEALLINNKEFDKAL
jgi:inosine/xanthosine triphosphate pyrophosphatase family protein/adenylate kinase family enzyme